MQLAADAIVPCIANIGGPAEAARIVSTEGHPLDMYSRSIHPAMAIETVLVVGAPSDAASAVLDSSGPGSKP